MFLCFSMEINKQNLVDRLVQRMDLEHIFLCNGQYGRLVGGAYLEQLSPAEVTPEEKHLIK